MKPHIMTSSGVARFLWISSTSTRPKFGDCLRRRDSQSRRSSSAGRTRRKWSTKAEGRTFGHGNLTRQPESRNVFSWIVVTICLARGHGFKTKNCELMVVNGREGRPKVVV